MHKITVVDYGFGNQFSIKQAFKMLGFKVLTMDNHVKFQIQTVLFYQV